MNTIIKIFKSDLRGLWKNKLALLIALAICVLPSLYAWFNIYSNWDPYSNTGTIPVAVVSLDEGYTSADGETSVMGDAVIDNLKENDKIGWKFVETEKKALDGVYSGEYYAAIIIGKDFSKSLYGFAENGLTHPSVTYYENEKKNPIASKITDTAKGTLQTSINEQFINVAVSTVMESMNQLADDEKKTQYIKKFIEKLNSVDGNLDDYLATIDQLISCNQTLSSNLKTAGTEVTGASGKLKNGVSQANQAKNEAITTISTLESQMDQVYQQIHTKLSNVSLTLGKDNLTKEEIDQVIGNVSDSSQQIELLKKLLDNDLIPEGSTKDDITKLLDNIRETTDAIHNTLKNEADNLQNQAENLHNQISSDRAAIKAAAGLVDAVLPIVEKQLQADITSMKSSISAAYNSMVASLNSMNQGLAGTGAALSSLGNTVNSSNSSFDTIKEIITSAKEDIKTLLTELNAVEDSDKYDQFIKILSAKPEVMGEFFEQPVSVVTERVYPVENYGSSVTPFYTILALWVGAVILVALIKVQVDKNEFSDAKTYEKYFGRFLLFLVLGQIQAAIVVFGDLYLLKVQCLDHGKFYLTAAFTSLVFNLLIYTLTVSFGDIGKAFVVVIMVIQIAGSSGTYPIEILPEFNRQVYLYFPFPYAINAMRETIGGMYGNDYWGYLSQLAVFGIIALIIGLFVRKPFIKMNHFVEKRMEDTKMM